MNRRDAGALLGTLLLAACGGGGGAGGSGEGDGVAAGASASSPVLAALSPQIALWGDSMVPPLARALAALLPGRAIHDGGVNGDTSMQVLERLRAADPALRERITFFWFGHNNIRLSGPQSAEQVKSDLVAAVDSLAPGNGAFIVLSLVNNAATGTAGTAEYDAIVRLNQDLAAAYPGHFFDIRRFMVDQADPGTAQGEADRRNDVPSSTLRADEIHLSGFGADVLARRLQSLLQELGW